MRELIGPCANCGKDVYCRDGFLEGVYVDEQLLCLDCAKESEEEKEK